jgi:hypothetical protein
MIYPWRCALEQTHDNRKGATKFKSGKNAAERLAEQASQGILAVHHALPAPTAAKGRKEADDQEDNSARRIASPRHPFQDDSSQAHRRGNPGTACHVATTKCRRTRRHAS